MSKRRITINITLDTSTAYVEDLDIIIDGNDRTEYVAFGVDNPISINNTAETISNELSDLLDDDFNYGYYVKGENE